MVAAHSRSANSAPGFVGRSRVSASLLVVAPPATLRHPSHLLPLLPSGPGGVHKLSSRRHQRSHHKTCSHRCGCLSTRGRAGCTRHILCLALRAACAARMGVLPMRRTRHAYFAGSNPAPHLSRRNERCGGLRLTLSSKLAERAGFEPAKRGLAAYTLSRRAPSTTRTPLRNLRPRGAVPPPQPEKPAMTGGGGY